MNEQTRLALAEFCRRAGNLSPEAKRALDLYTAAWEQEVERLRKVLEMIDQEFGYL